MTPTAAKFLGDSSEAFPVHGQRLYLAVGIVKSPAMGSRVGSSFVRGAGRGSEAREAGKRDPATVMGGEGCSLLIPKNLGGRVKGFHGRMTRKPSLGDMLGAPV